MDFSWDPKKNKSNRNKHNVSFEEASTCFYDPMHILIRDPDHTPEEERMILIGVSSSLKLLVVAHIEPKQNNFRIISARKATRLERKQYEEV